MDEGESIGDNYGWRRGCRDDNCRWRNGDAEVTLWVEEEGCRADNCGWWKWDEEVTSVDGGRRI